MNSLLQSPMPLPMLLLLVGAFLAAIPAGIWLLRRRGRKSEAERERDRRMALNAIGRMTDGILTDSQDSGGAPLLFYRYSIRGVEYSAAQDVSCLRNMIAPGGYLPGETVIVKYDQHRPSNSIIVCEVWSGLGADTVHRKPAS